MRVGGCDQFSLANNKSVSGAIQSGPPSCDGSSVGNGDCAVPEMSRCASVAVIDFPSRTTMVDACKNPFQQLHRHLSVQIRTFT